MKTQGKGTGYEPGSGPLSSNTDPPIADFQSLELKEITFLLFISYKNDKTEATLLQAHPEKANSLEKNAGKNRSQQEKRKTKYKMD